jgi:starch phosphorylase
MKNVRRIDGALGGYVYGTAVFAVRPQADFTARLIPHHDGVAIPLEDARILWQR